MSTPLLDNISNQPAALEAVVGRALGEGRAHLEQVAELIRAKRRVILTGMGASLFACQALGYELAAHGIEATVVDTAELLYFTPAVLDRDTAVILVSRSGESIEVAKALSIVRAAGATAIGITNVPDSTLARQADLSLLLGSPADQMVAIQSYTGTALLLAVLGSAIAREFDKAHGEACTLIAALRPLISEQIRDRASWDELFDTGSPIYILGRGPSCASVTEGVLLMHETAKVPAIGMSVAQFRHGPVEVVDSRFRAVVLASHPSTYGLDRGLADDLAGMEAKVRLVTAPQEIPPRLSPIVEVVTLQIAAYRRAELNGVHPGDFRWAPLVTTAEAGFGPLR